jgi:bifunctional DNA-binding transcriptional regulator/antitoxin component of YhaV-PrlF toxin-antitoxin module
MPTPAKLRLVRPLAKGQITLPVAFRRELGIDAATILRVALRQGKIEISPWRPRAEEEQLRTYSSAKIRQFLREDRLDAKTAARVRHLLESKR